MDRPRQFAAGDAPLAHWFKTGTKTTGTKGGRGLTRRTRTLWQQPAFVAMAATILGRTEGTSRTAGLALRTVGPWRAARRAALVSGTRSSRATLRAGNFLANKELQRSRNRRAMAESQTRSRLSSKMRSASAAAVNQSLRASSASSWLGPQPA